MGEGTKMLQSLIDRGGAHVVIPPGVYREGELRIPRGKVVDGAGKVTIEGSVGLRDEWKSEGHLRGHAYTAIPARDGHGISFTHGQNLNDPLGKYADQVWTRAAGDTRLRRVTDKRHVTAGHFAVESGMLWVHEDDHAKGILASGLRVAVTELAGTLKGVTIARFSPTAADGAAIRVKSGTLDEVKVDGTSFVAISIDGGTHATLQRVTVTRAGWMGVAALLTDDVKLDGCVFDRINDWGVFANSPQSGAVKTSRCRRVVIHNVTVKDSNGHGLWFDQSTLDVEVSNCTVDVGGRAVFFEISSGLKLSASRLSGHNGGLRVAGSNGVRVVGCDISSDGSEAVAIMVDPRGRPGWSNPATRTTAEMHRIAPWISSDRQPASRWSSRLTWQPEVVAWSGNHLHPAHGHPSMLVTHDHTGLHVSDAHIFPNGRPR